MSLMQRRKEMLGLVAQPTRFILSQLSLILFKDLIIMAVCASNRCSCKCNK